ncbi:tryptophan--tRNA ligase, partial [Candidatus Micrarchaeota archaeon CG11_big_fil_rev_8_21_14_0_20_47_5]
MLDPWANQLVEYEKLFGEFGLKRIEEGILKRIKNKGRIFGRGIVFAHRDLDKFLEAREKGQEVAVMSGIKPSNEFHLGSKMTADEMIYFQKEFGAKVFYAIADLEAYADNGVTLEEGGKFAVSNLADMLALGLDEKNAYIWRQSQEVRVMNMAYLFSKRVTDAALRALYGEKEIGLYFSALTQAGDILLPQHPDFGGKKHVLVPVGADQDPHIRMTRDIAAKEGLVLPSSTYHVYAKSLSGEQKMSKRDPLGVLFLSDTPEIARKKIMRAFTGGRATVEEQRKKGGEIGKCVVYELAKFHFLEDKELKEMERRCLCGEVLCGEDKEMVAEKVCDWLKKHQ